MVKKKKIKAQNLNDVNSTREGASHITSDNSKSYSEVSFNVLEKAVESRNKKFGYKSKDFKNRSIISSDEMLYDKKKKHKARKKNASNIGKLAITTIVLIVVFICISYLMFYFSNNGYLIKVKHSNPLKSSIVQISDFDKDIAILNNVLSGPINSSRLSQSKITKEDLEKTKKGLNELSYQIGNIGQELNTDTEDYQYVGVAKQAIESRIMMIDSGLKVLESAKNSLMIIDQAEEFWDNVLKADNLLKEADYLIESNALESYIMAKNNSEKAVELLNKSKEQMVTLSSITKDFDFKTYASYIEASLDAAKCSVDAISAIIEQDLDKTANLNLLYLQKSNIASDIALSISTTPVQVIRTNYDLNTRPFIEEYKAARNNAADNDFILRNFLSMS